MEDVRERVLPIIGNIKLTLNSFVVREWDEKLEFIEDIFGGVYEEYDEDYDTMREEVEDMMDLVGGVYDEVDSHVIPLLWIILDISDHAIEQIPAYQPPIPLFHNQIEEDEGYYSELNEIPDDY